MIQIIQHFHLHYPESFFGLFPTKRMVFTNPQTLAILMRTENEILNDELKAKQL